MNVLHRFLRGLESAVLLRIFEVAAKLPGGQALKRHLVRCRRHMPILRRSRRQMIALEILVLMACRAFLPIHALAVLPSGHSLRMRRHSVTLRRNVTRRMTVRTPRREKYLRRLIERRDRHRLAFGVAKHPHERIIDPRRSEPPTVPGKARSG